MTASVWLIEPFMAYGFMRRALVATWALSLGGAPLGTLLVLRRMSLVGDAMGHALLPGAAVGFLIAGFSLAAMSLGGFVAALSVALAAGFVTRVTSQREDASFAAFYLIALALGVLLVSTHGSSVDLMHLLFGTILAVDDAALILMAAVAGVSLLVLAVIYRPLLVECLDPGFLRNVGGRGHVVHGLFLVLTVANLVAGFQALGTLMAVGLMMLPAVAARFWAGEVWTLALVAACISAVSGAAGLLLSFHAQWPSGPSIVLVAGGFYLLSLVFGPRDGLLGQQKHIRSHRSA
jgi:zinc/manganese transport system permease protein